MIFGSLQADYFTQSQQDLIRQFVDRRGGALLLLGGQYGLADGELECIHRCGPAADAIFPTRPGTFLIATPIPGSPTGHATVELAPAGVDSIITRLVDDPAANAAKWKKLPYLMDYEDAGTAKPGAETLAYIVPPEGPKTPLLVTQKFGRGRSAIMATGGSWRWQMSSPLGDTAYYLFWQQLMRWLVSDTPRPRRGYRTSSGSARQRLPYQPDGGGSR